MIIDFETHFFTKACIDYLVQQKTTPNLVPEGDGYTMCFTDTVKLFHSQALLTALCDIGEGRIAEMDKSGVTVQVLSLTTANGIDSGPGDEARSTALARETNDLLHAAIQKNPDRFRGFAAISPYDVDAAVKELERAIKQLHFTGWLTHSNYGPEADKPRDVVVEAGVLLLKKKCWALVQHFLPSLLRKQRNILIIIFLILFAILIILQSLINLIE